METYVESARSSLGGEMAGLSVRLLGPLTIARNGIIIQLPKSRKLCALLAYLALAPHPVGRSRLCELLWDVPNDPRGELRWCLSKLRGILDEPHHRRVETPGDTIALDLTGASVDAVDIASAAAKGVETLGRERLQAFPEGSPATFSMGWRSTAAPISTAG